MHINESVESFFENNLEGIDQKITEAISKHERHNNYKIKLRIGIIALAVISISLYVITKSIIPLLIFIFSFPFFSVLFNRKDYDIYLHDIVIPYFKLHYKNFSFTNNPKLKLLKLNVGNFLAASGEYSSKTLLRLKLDNNELFVFDFELAKMKKEKPRYKLLYIEYPKSFKETTTIIPKNMNVFSALMATGSGLKPIKFESQEFHKCFNIRSTDPLEAHYLLPPDIISTMLDIEEKWECDVSFMFYKQKLFITLHDNFEFLPRNVIYRLGSSSVKTKLKKDAALLNNIVDILVKLKAINPQ